MTDALISGIVVFVLAMFVGFEVITKVPSLLHTPLTSGANAIGVVSEEDKRDFVMQLGAKAAL